MDVKNELSGCNSTPFWGIFLPVGDALLQPYGSPLRSVNPQGLLCYGLSDDLFLFQDEYNDAADKKKAAEDNQENYPSADAFHDLEAVLGAVADLVLYDNAVRACLGAEVKEQYSNMLRNAVISLD